MSDDFIPWSHLYDINVRKIDEQHKGLAKLINDFHHAVVSGHKREVVFFLLNSLIRYSEEHFRDEEALMAESHYPELIRQKLEHEKLIFKVFDLAARYERNEAEIDEDVMAFLKSWLIDHILTEDRKLDPYLRKKGLPPGW